MTTVLSLSIQVATAYYILDLLVEIGVSTVERATKEALMTPRLKTDEAEIEGVGTVLVRGLSRWEMVEVQKLENDRQKQDNLAVAYGLVEPEMAEHEVMAWRKAGSVIEIEAIARKINELSGIGKDAAKSNVSGDGDGPDAGV